MAADDSHFAFNKKVRIEIEPTAADATGAISGADHLKPDQACDLKISDYMTEFGGSHETRIG